MTTRAVIDIGSHSILLLVARGARGTGERPLVLAEDCRITALGAGIAGSGRIDSRAIRLTLRIVEKYLSRCRELGVERALGVGTSALREAANREEVLRILSGSGLQIRILGGAEEAQLTRQGALFGLEAGADALVADVGGRSTEITWPGHSRSLPLGCQRDYGEILCADPPQTAQIAHQRQLTQSALAELPAAPTEGRLVCSGGTAVTLAAIDLFLDTYQPKRIHGHLLSARRLFELGSILAAVPLSAREAIVGVEPGRAGVLPAGTIILEEILRWSGREEILISTRGLTWGVWLQGETGGNSRGK